MVAVRRWGLPSVADQLTKRFELAKRPAVAGNPQTHGVLVTRNTVLRADGAGNRYPAQLAARNPQLVR